MTRDQRDIPHLIDVATEMGITVVERKGRHRGGYHDGLRQIRLNPGMSERVTRSFLAHEIAHAVFRDVPSPYGPVKAKQERRAWEWAALYLIDPASFAETEKHRDGHSPSMATALMVTVEVVDALRQILSRVRDTVSAAPQVDAAQFSHRLVARS